MKSTKTATGICPFFYGAYAKKWFAIAAAKQNNISFEKLDTQKYKTEKLPFKTKIWYAVAAKQNNISYEQDLKLVTLIVTLIELGRIN